MSLATEETPGITAIVDRLLAESEGKADLDTLTMGVLDSLSDAQLRQLAWTPVREVIRLVLNRKANRSFDKFTASDDEVHELPRAEHAATSRSASPGAPSNRSRKWEQVREDQERVSILETKVVFGALGGIVKKLGDCYRPELRAQYDLLRERTIRTADRAAQFKRLAELLTDDRTPLSVVGEQRVINALGKPKKTPTPIGSAASKESPASGSTSTEKAA